MRNLALTTILLSALLGGASFAAPASPIEERDIVWDEVVVTTTVTVTVTAGENWPTVQPSAPPPPLHPQPVHHHHSVFTTTKTLPPPPPTAAAAPAPSSASPGSSPNTCPTFPGMTNPLIGASESYCCTETAPCGIAQNPGAEATYYSMAGGIGACGQSLPDTASFVAVNSQIMGKLSNGEILNPLCGKTVVVRNAQTGETATGTVADKCPGCKTGWGIDLSPAVFSQLAPEVQGVFPVEWWFTDL